MDIQTIYDAAFVGRVLLSEPARSHLEAFPANALYCGRGMPTMHKYKTVKEVCDLTGLTRNHLYYFHHAKVVQAVAYANYSVEGNDGYKLYDDAAVEKLQQIALYYQLGLKRDEIRDIMLDPNYDSIMVLDTLLAIEQSKKATIERHIAALEYLKHTGTKNRLLSPLRGMSLKELGETILTLRKTTQCDGLIAQMSEPQADAFSKEFSRRVTALQSIDPSNAESQTADKVIRKLIETGRKYLGDEGVAFVLGFFVAAMSHGTVMQELQSNISLEHAKMVVRYFVKHPELYKQLSAALD